MRISALVVAVAVVVGGCGKTTAPKTELPDCTVGGVNASPASVTLHPGDTLRVRALVTPCPQDPFTSTFWWRSSDTSVASVDSSAGLIHARQSGQATVIGMATINSAVSVAAFVNVVP